MGANAAPGHSFQSHLCVGNKFIIKFIKDLVLPGAYSPPFAFPGLSLVAFEFSNPEVKRPPVTLGGGLLSFLLDWSASEP